MTPDGLSNYAEIHPYPTYIPEQAKLLIVGSFPPVKLTRGPQIPASDPLYRVYRSYLQRNEKKADDIDYYYGSAGNYFWKVLERLYGVELRDVNRIKGFLDNNHIGITDMAEICVRRVIDLTANKKVRPDKVRKLPDNYRVSSADSLLSVLKYRDPREYLRSYDSIVRVVFTGSFALGLFGKLLRRDGFAANLVKNGTFPKLADRKVEIVLVPSPSGAANISIGGSPSYRRKRKFNPSYTTFDYRLEKYQAALDV